jgi:hypothetical protein
MIFSLFSRGRRMKGWAVEEFSGVDFGDSRLNARLIHTAERLSEVPMASMRQACGDSASAKGAFRFFDNANVSAGKILEPHIQSTIERIKEEGSSVVLALQDTSYLSYDHHPSTEGLGPISPAGQQSGCEGLIMHTCLAVSTTGETLGILGQKTWARTHIRGRTKSRSQVKPEKKESFKWIEMVREVNHLLGPEIKAIHITDREGDIFSVFEEVETCESNFLIRAFQPRKEVKTGKNIFKFLKSQPICGTLEVEAEHPRSDKIETIFLTVKVGKATIKKGGKRLQVNGIAVQEKTKKRTPLTWFLLTNLEVNNFKSSAEKVQWYRFRWRIETFHKILKSGYQIEDCRLRHAERLERYIALISVVAWRLHWIKLFALHHPLLPCTKLFSETEWHAIYLRSHRTKKFPAEIPSLNDTVRDLAKMGGFLARKSDGEPGVVTLWRGLFSLYETIQTLRILDESAAICGYK